MSYEVVWFTCTEWHWSQCWYSSAEFVQERRRKVQCQNCCQFLFPSCRGIFNVCSSVSYYRILVRKFSRILPQPSWANKNTPTWARLTGFHQCTSCSQRAGRSSCCVSRVMMRSSSILSSTVIMSKVFLNVGWVEAEPIRKPQFYCFMVGVISVCLWDNVRITLNTPPQWSVWSEHGVLNHR